MAKRGNGEGTIYYSEKLNKWIGQFTAGRKSNGKLNRKSVYGNTRKEVKEKMTKALSEVQADNFTEKNDITLLEVIDLCINQLKNSNRIKQTTYNRDLQTKKIIDTKIPCSHKPIQKITIVDFNTDFKQLTDYANSVIDKTYGLIRQAYNFAMLNGFINKDLFSIKGAIIKPISNKEDKDIEALEVDEQLALMEELKKCNDKYKNIIYIALFTGMRVGEILALKSEDINLDKNIINVNKTLTRDENERFVVGSTTKTYAGKREIPILKDISLLMNEYAKRKGYLFQVDKKFINPSTINSHFKKICKNANIKVTTTQKKKHYKKSNKDTIINLKSSNVNTHMLRHTFATRCIEAGINPAVLQRILGHKNIEITLNTYTSIFNRYKEQEIEKVELYFSQLH